MRTAFLLLVVLLMLSTLIAGCTQFTVESGSVSTPATTAAATPSAIPSPAVSPTFALSTTSTETPTIAPSPSIEATASGADGTVYSTDTFIGYFVEFQFGDYGHVCIRTEDGEERWFWISGDCHTDFEGLTPGQKLQVTWINVDKYVDEAEKVINMDMITEAIILG